MGTIPEPRGLKRARMDSLEHNLCPASRQLSRDCSSLRAWWSALGPSSSSSRGILKRLCCMPKKPRSNTLEGSEGVIVIIVQDAPRTQVVRAEFCRWLSRGFAQGIQVLDDRVQPGFSEMLNPTLQLLTSRSLKVRAGVCAASLDRDSGRQN